LSLHFFFIQPLSAYLVPENDIKSPVISTPATPSAKSPLNPNYSSSSSSTPSIDTSSSPSLRKRKSNKNTKGKQNASPNSKKLGRNGPASGLGDLGSPVTPTTPGGTKQPRLKKRTTDQTKFRVSAWKFVTYFTQLVIGYIALVNEGEWVWEPKRYFQGFPEEHIMR
jgi:hypothetical protein